MIEVSDSVVRIHVLLPAEVALRADHESAPANELWVIKVAARLIVHTSLLEHTAEQVDTSNGKYQEEENEDNYCVA